MRIFLACSAPGTEDGITKLCSTPKRLLSFWHIKENVLICGTIFKYIKKIKKIKL